MFVDGEDGDLENGHDEELHGTGFTQNSTEGDQDRGCAEVCIDYSAGQEVISKMRRKQHPIICLQVYFHFGALLMRIVTLDASMLKSFARL